MNKDSKVFIILAIYNEQDNIVGLISGIRNEFSTIPYKIIAVDDGSHDQSLAILHEINKGDIFIESHKINMNIGAVFSTGINLAANMSSDNDVIVMMESDQTSDPALLHKLFNSIVVENYDVCIASRYIKGGGYKNFPFLRYFYSRAANMLIKHIFPIKGVRDYTIFYRAYRGSTLKKLIDYYGPYNFIQSRGFVSNAEVLIKCSLFTEEIFELPFMYDYGKKEGKSKLKIVRTLIEYFQFIFFMKGIAIKIKSNK